MGWSNDYLQYLFGLIPLHGATTTDRLMDQRAGKLMQSPGGGSYYGEVLFPASAGQPK